MKIKLKRTTLIFIILVLFALIAISSYAKYTTTSNTESSFKIAKWSFKENSSSNTIISLTADTEIFPNLAENKIAPGTFGEVEIQLDASGSDVSIEYDIKITPVDSKILPVGLTIEQDNLSGVINHSSNPQDMKKTILVPWKWTYGNNVTDLNYDENLNIGSNNDESGTTTSLNIEIIGKQRMPGEV